jgi:hypothetical protein
MHRTLLIVPLLAATACSRPSRGDAPARADSSISQPAATPLREVRQMRPGAKVTVTGVVTVESGVVDAGFALQDGPQAIYVAADDTTTPLRAGQMARVTGTLADEHGLLVVRPATVEATGRTAPLPAYQLRTKRVGEITESMLVSVSGRVTGAVVDDRPYGWKIVIDDGSGRLQLFVPIHQTLDPPPYRAGQRLEAEGLSAQYDSTYEVITTKPLKIVQ